MHARAPVAAVQVTKNESSTMEKFKEQQEYLTDLHCFVEDKVDELSSSMSDLQAMVREQASTLNEINKAINGGKLPSQQYNQAAVPSNFRVDGMNRIDSIDNVEELGKLLEENGDLDRLVSCQS